MMSEFIKDLSGHSGCRILLYKDDHKFFVRKTSWKVSYNERLQLQLEKQKSFQSDRLCVPLVYDSWFVWDLFYFDMQYVNCQTFASYIWSITVKEITSFVELALEHLDFSWSYLVKDSNQIFQKKIRSLKESCPVTTSLEDQAFFLLEHFDFSTIPHSKCHGDLTLENILITPEKKIYLIDFLDSFYDSWMMDVAKLLQDLYLHRSYRHHQMNVNLHLRLTIAKQALLEAIQEKDPGNTYLIGIYHLLLLNLLRIIPYTHDDTTKNFLQNAIQSVLTLLTSNTLLSWKL